MPFGQEKIDPLEQMRNTISGIAQTDMKNRLGLIQLEKDKAETGMIKNITDAYVDKIKNPSINPQDEHNSYVEAYSNLLGMGTEKAFNAAQAMSKLRPPAMKTGNPIYTAEGKILQPVLNPQEGTVTYQEVTDNKGMPYKAPPNKMGGMTAAQDDASKRGWAGLQLRQHQIAQQATIAQQKIKSGKIGDDDVKPVADLIGRYGMPPLSGFVLRTPQGLKIMSEVSKNYPGYNANYYSGNNKLMTEYTSGKASNNALSLNTVAQHLDQFKDLSEALKNNDVQKVNQLTNWFQQETGHPEISNFNLIKDFVGDELATTLKGAAATDIGEESMLKNFKSDLAPAQASQLVDTALKGVSKRLSSLVQRFEGQWHGDIPPDVNVLTQDGRNVFEKYGIPVHDVWENKTSKKTYTGGGEETPKATTGNTTSKKEPMPKVGDIIDGHKFLGGDPHKKESWQAQ